MAGLEKIIDQIVAEANTEAEKVFAQATQTADQILAEAREKQAQIVSGIQKKSASDIDNYQKRVESANDLYRRTQLLAAKQELISQVIDQAYEKVCAMEPGPYFAMIEKMLAKYVLDQSGEICFSEKDLKRMPEGFETVIAQIAQKAKGSLKLSREGKMIENGFVLIYGGIEENCTIKAVFDARHDDMQDTVNALLFGKEA